MPNRGSDAGGVFMVAAGDGFSDDTRFVTAFVYLRADHTAPSSISRRWTHRSALSDLLPDSLLRGSRMFHRVKRSCLCLCV